MCIRDRDETVQILSVKKERKKVQPPKLYDLTTLQREANRLLGFTAQQTLDYTQSLYEKKLVTYPRTDSQYLTDDMEENAFLVIDLSLIHILKIITLSVQQKESLMTVVTNFGMLQHMYPRAYFVVKYYLQ